MPSSLARSTCNVGTVRNREEPDGARGGLAPPSCLGPLDFYRHAASISVPGSQGKKTYISVLGLQRGHFATSILARSASAC